MASIVANVYKALEDALAIEMETLLPEQIETKRSARQVALDKAHIKNQEFVDELILMMNLEIKQYREFGDDLCCGQAEVAAMQRAIELVKNWSASKVKVRHDS